MGFIVLRSRYHDIENETILNEVVYCPHFIMIEFCSQGGSRTHHKNSLLIPLRTGAKQNLSKQRCMFITQLKNHFNTLSIIFKSDPNNHLLPSSSNSCLNGFYVSHSHLLDIFLSCYIGIKYCNIITDIQPRRWLTTPTTNFSQHDTLELYILHTLMTLR